MSNDSTLGAACSAPGNLFSNVTLADFYFTDGPLLWVTHLSSAEQEVFWNARVTQQLLSIPRCSSHSGSEQVRSLSSYIFIGHDKTTEAVDFVLPPPPRENPRVYRLLAAKRKKKLSENRLLSWRRGQPFTKMSNDLWSLTIDWMAFLLVLSGVSLGVRSSWKLSL